MEPFSFSIPQNIIFGRGSLDRLPELAGKLNKNKAFLISGPYLEKIGMVHKCRQTLENAGIASGVFSETEGNPSVETVEKARMAFRESKADVIIAFGGGSPLDVAKAVAVLETFGGKITDYEGGDKVPGPVIPVIAIPTTAGTGSEVTAFSVITDHSRNYKLTVASKYLLPAYAVLDPELIMTVPEKTAAACGIDALVHALEAYLSLASSVFTDLFALKALQLIGKNLRRYVANRKNPEAAEGMMLGSMFAGIAFSHARLGDVHAMSHPVSAYFNVPHGVANAVLLPGVVAFNELADSGKYYDIYQCIAKTPVKRELFLGEMLTAELKKLNKELGIPDSFKNLGVKEETMNKMAEDAMKSGNVAVNPRSTSKEDMITLYKKVF